MSRKHFLIVSIAVLTCTMLFVANVMAWNFNGASVECEGFWNKNVDTDATTNCTITGPIQSDGSYGDFSAVVWCVNPNNPGSVLPPKQTDITVFSGSESNQNGRKVKGKVNLTVHIDTLAAVPSTVCNQGNSGPSGNGQWQAIKVLPSSAFTGIVSTLYNNGSTRQEVYSCGTPTLFTDGTNMSDKLDEITQALIDGQPVSSLGLTYNCQLVSAT